MKAVLITGASSARTTAKKLSKKESSKIIIHKLLKSYGVVQGVCIDFLFLHSNFIKTNYNDRYKKNTSGIGN
tara:strand:+ start:816 stop:1031 length:216 start_codon:yes stop_codon:yes gene_type:complete